MKYQAQIDESVSNKVAGSGRPRRLVERFATILESDMADIHVTQGYNGATVSTAVGDTITVDLPETPTTGYRWACDSGDSSILAFIGDSFQLSDQSAVGGGGVRSFRFAVQQIGTAQIVCKLARSWESGTPRETFAIQVTST